jgi:hypothetical protein
VLGEGHLRRILSRYAVYNGTRIGGLHLEYARTAASSTTDE